MVSDGGITITWLGHATTRIETAEGKTILIDPWLESNPAVPENLKQIDRLDLMLITHGHFDHMGDAVSVAEHTQPDIIANFEITTYLDKRWGIQKTNGINQGGTVDWNGVQITLTPAVHSSGISDDGNVIYGGEAGGFVLRFPDGFTIYHSGDTDLFSDMRLIGERHHPNVAMLPIGGHYTMNPTAAAEALRLLNVPVVIPIHWGTFPILTGNPDALREAAGDLTGLKIVALKPGESIGQSDLA